LKVKRHLKYSKIPQTRGGLMLENKCANLIAESENFHYMPSKDLAFVTNKKNSTNFKKLSKV
jgi:hypothetical protein